MRRPANILLLAIVVGALSAALIYRYMRSLRAELEAARSTDHATVKVVVAKEQIGIGTRIEAKHVELVDWPADLEPVGALHDLPAAVDRVSKVTLEKNQPLNDTYLLAQGGSLMPLMIPEGMRAMSVKVDDVTGVSGFITPNSRVDVLISERTNSETDEQRSKLILQNIRVLATGKQIEQHDDKPVEVPTVTLQVTPEEAEKLTLAARFDPVRLALRKYGDEEVIPTPGVSSGNLFGNAAPAGPGAPAAAGGGDGRRARYSVEVLLGDQVTRQEIF